ncbi:MAG: hypothetical protein JKX85_07770 [Phycisphaeraceae bacterium]|nr:hypothetical protein [Phycisphaeraceae bacterium]
MLIPEASWQIPSQLFIEHDEITAQWLDEQIPESLKATWQDLGQSGHSSGSGHLSIDYALIVKQGIHGVLAKLDQPTVQTLKSQTTRKAMRLTCEALIKWANRLADHAQQLADTCDDPTLATCHQRVANACRHVPQYPARDLFEALQSMMLIHLSLALEGQGLSISIGLPDRALDAFIHQVDEDFQGSVQLIRAFLVGIASNSYTGRGSKTQAITLGGALPDESDAANSVTLAFLHAFEQTPVADPHCFFRWHPNVDSAIWDKVIALLSKGRSMPLLVNDQQVVPGLVASGITKDDAWNYCVVGCNELGIPGRLSECSACYGLYFNDLKLLNEGIRQNPDTFKNTQQIVEHWGQAFENAISRSMPHRTKQLHHHRETLPMMVTSCFCHGCA